MSDSSAAPREKGEIMRVLAIDPGPTISAFIDVDDGKPITFGIIPNDELLEMILASRVHICCEQPDQLVIEWVSFYGKDIHPGSETFEMCRWVGRFEQAWNEEATFTLIPRRQVRGELCGTQKAGDAEIRAVLIDRYGGKDRAIGLKKSRGPLYGIASHCWSALAVAITFLDRQVKLAIAAQQIHPEGAE